MLKIFKFVPYILYNVRNYEAGKVNMYYVENLEMVCDNKSLQRTRNIPWDTFVEIKATRPWIWEMRVYISRDDYDSVPWALGISKCV